MEPNFLKNPTHLKLKKLGIGLMCEIKFKFLILDGISVTFLIRIGLGLKACLRAKQCGFI